MASTSESNTPAGELSGRHVVLGLSGGIACYKSAELTRELVRAGAGPCTMAVVAVTSETVLDLAPGLRQIMLYILAPDGTLASTERVPIR